MKEDLTSKLQQLFAKPFVHSSCLPSHSYSTAFTHSGRSLALLLDPTQVPHHPSLSVPSLTWACSAFLLYPTPSLSPLQAKCPLTSLLIQYHSITINHSSKNSSVVSRKGGVSMCHRRTDTDTGPGNVHSRKSKDNPVPLIRVKRKMLR